MATTYWQIANHARVLINGINGGHAGAPTAQAYLGACAPWIARHFPPGHLANVQITLMPAGNPVPGPAMGLLENLFGHPHAGAARHTIAALMAGMGVPCWLETECAFGVHNVACACGGAHAHVWDVLVRFSDPVALAFLAGVTYDQHIYLANNHADDLPTIVHELVHTIQWQQLGPAGFLWRYIRGWATRWINVPPLNNYWLNPAEAIARNFETQWRGLMPPALAHVMNVGAWRTGAVAVPAWINQHFMAPALADRFGIIANPAAATANM